MTSIERYSVLRELGRGTIGTVYAATDRSTGALVALKTLDPALVRAADAELAGRFLQNARSAASLRHRNIVRVFDAGEAGGTAYIAMELVEGETLRALLDKGPLPIARAIQFFDDIASALAYAHEEKMVHRGVKPSNIIITPAGVAKIGDFGIGQIGEAALRYTSPEQVRRDPVDHRSDLFSLGVVLYEMLTGRAPFAADSPAQIRENIVRAQPALPSQVNPHVPAALDAMVSRLLAARPDDRFANARDVLRELQRLEDALGLRPSIGTSTSTAAAAPPEAARPEAPMLAEDLEHRIQIPVGFMADREPRLEPPSGSRIASFLAALAVVLAMASIGLTVLFHYSPELIDRLTVAIRTLAAPAPAKVAAAVPPPAPAAEPMKELAPAPAPVPLPAVASVAAAPQPVPPALLVEEPPAAEIKKIPEPQPIGTAKLIIAVSPGGDLYVDGEHHGATPPIRTLDLEPGMHRIEIRSGSRKPYLTYVTVKAGEERRIRHDFSAKLTRRPPR